jgi:hypothetical protein
MRSECKHYESRTYRGGETVRKCKLDLAPEAPWRCPADCPSFELRLVDATFKYGGMVAPPTPPEPPNLGPDAVALLDEAEDIVNAAVAGAIAEVEKRKPWWRRLRRG